MTSTIENIDESKTPQQIFQDNDSQLLRNLKKNEINGTIMPYSSLQQSDLDTYKDTAVDEDEDFSDLDEKKLVRKIDLHLIPVFTLLYLLSFLDRGNIGNAKIEGLAEDLNLSSTQYTLVLLIFFIFYSLLEIPANIILKHVNPAIFIPITMVLWLIAMTCSGVVNNYHQLLATRSLLGIFESPSFPAISFILSLYYKKNEVLIREAVFFSAASIAGAFSGLLAAAISKMDGIGGYAGWRWIFILEGLLTLVYSVALFFLFPRFPESAGFLSERERKFAVHRVKCASNSDGAKFQKSKEDSTNTDDLSNVESGIKTHIYREDHTNDKSYIWAVFKDYKCYLQLLAYYGVCVPLYGVSLFTPTIIRTLGYSSTKTQLLSAPVYLVAAVVSIIQAVISSKVGLRSPFLLFNYLCMAVGYIVCITGDPGRNPKAIYAGSYIVALGIYPAFPMIVIWNANNLSGSYKRAVGMAFQIGVGNLSGAISSSIYRGQDAPKYTLGHGLELMFIGLGLIAISCLIFGYSFENKQKKQRLQLGYYDNYTEEELNKLGDKSPHYTYRL